MKKVLAFGTFDHLHPGHEYFLTEAKKLGDHLTVIVGRDTTVKQIKGKLPRQTENERLTAIQDLSFVDKARLGNQGDKFQVITEEAPDIIALGYDQTAFVDELTIRFKQTIPIVRLESFFPEKYKSSKMI